MKKCGKKFKATTKLKILDDWNGTQIGAVHTARKHDCSVSSIWKWHALTVDAQEYDEKIKALENKSSKPHYSPKEHTEQETESVKDLLTKHNGIGRLELFSRLRTEKAYTRSIRTMYRVVKKLNIIPVADIVKYEPKPYETPKMLGVKWQIDVKYVPRSCIPLEQQSIDYGNYKGLRYYQYTMIDECTRERFIFAYDSFGTANTIDFMKRCIVFMGYKPLIVQTDNGGEFTNNNINVKNVHAFTLFLNSLDIKHKLIRPATPRHNGKVERSHRTDNEEFYKYNVFYSLNDLRTKMQDWLVRYNTVRISSVLNYITPNEKREKLLAQLDRATKIQFDDLESTIKFVKQNRDLALSA